MKNINKVHCLFEQSGTFKNEFKKLGFQAEDYDIQDCFGETDHVIDLFSEIDNAYEGKPSVFDTFDKDDLLVAFYPCIYFSCMSQMLFSFTHRNYRNCSDEKKIAKIIDRNHNRAEFYERLLKFVGVCLKKNLRMVFENPYSMQTELKVFLKKPDVLDMDRTKRGDYMRKPTGYWFWNCTPGCGQTYEPYQGEVISPTRLPPSKVAGVCGKERSMITSTYAKNWIKDFILEED